MNSRSLYFHAKRVMAIVENAISSLDDAEVLIECLTNLGQKHQPWSITQEHFRVKKLFCSVLTTVNSLKVDTPRRQTSQ